METIGSQKVWSFFDSRAKCLVAKNADVRKGAGHKVSSYLELATKIAELQFRNRDHVLFFRGQGSDHKNIKGNTSLKPTLFRPKQAGNPNRTTLEARFKVLEQAEQVLIERYVSSGFLGIDRLQRHRILRWSILQHYEVCKTPLLDVTHSIRIAASFASLATTGKAFLYVLGVPNLSGAITASAEAGLQIVRLSSVCPPSAVRPHIQEGYLLGEYPELAGYKQKENYFHYEMDFGRRLVAKFWFNPASFWKSDNFPKVARTALYPTEQNDPLYKLALEVQKELDGAD
jgi:hypothetical protein